MQKLFATCYFFTALLVSGNAQTSSKMHINQQAPVQKTNQIHIQASPERVWAVLTDINNWPTWHPGISRAQVSALPLAAGTRFDWKVNGAKIKSTLHTVIAHEIFGWSGTTFGGSAIHNWYLESQNGGTLVRVEESMEGWLVSLFKRKMNRDLEKDMQLWLEHLKNATER